VRLEEKMCFDFKGGHYLYISDVGILKVTIATLNIAIIGSPEFIVTLFSGLR
jgi:hypothetical protein